MADFLVSTFVTAREPDEVLVGVVVPAARAGEGRAYDKAKFRERPAVSVAVRLLVVDGSIAEAHVAVGSMTDTPILVPAAAAALPGAAAEASALEGPLAAGAAAMSEVDAAADLDGAPDYKRHLAGVLLGRAARAALAEAVARA